MAGKCGTQGGPDHRIRIGSQESVMCGRYRLSRRKELIAEYFDTDNEVDWERVREAPHGSRLELLMHGLKVQLVHTPRQVLRKPQFVLDERLVDQQLC